MTRLQKLALVSCLSLGVSAALAGSSQAATIVKPIKLPILVKPIKKPIVIGSDTFKEVADAVKGMVKGQIFATPSSVSLAANQAF